MKGSVDSIETFGLVDGPGIRTVIFLNGCSLRCKFCHNPETWKIGELNYTSDEIVEKVPAPKGDINAPTKAINIPINLSIRRFIIYNYSKLKCFAIIDCL